MGVHLIFQWEDLCDGRMTDGSTAGPAVESPAGGGEGVRDTRHVLTEVERGWCTELRAALKAQGVPEPEPRCDFTLAQFA